MCDCDLKGGLICPAIDLSPRFRLEMVVSGCRPTRSFFEALPRRARNVQRSQGHFTGSETLTTLQVTRPQPGVRRGKSKSLPKSKSHGCGRGRLTCNSNRSHRAALLQWSDLLYKQSVFLQKLTLLLKNKMGFVVTRGPGGPPNEVSIDSLL